MRRSLNSGNDIRTKMSLWICGSFTLAQSTGLFVNKRHGNRCCTKVN